MFRVTAAPPKPDRSGKPAARYERGFGTKGGTILI